MFSKIPSKAVFADVFFSIVVDCRQNFSKQLIFRTGSSSDKEFGEVLAASLIMADKGAS